MSRKREPRWMPLDEAIRYLMRKERCSAEEAGAKLVKAMNDRKVRWRGERIVPQKPRPALRGSNDMTERIKTVTEELQSAIVCIEGAEAIYHDKTGGEQLADLFDACKAIERAMTKIQHARAKATASLDEF